MLTLNMILSKLKSVLFFKCCLCKGVGMINVGLFACTVNSSSVDVVIFFWVVIDMVDACFLCVSEGDGVTPGMVRQ